MKNEESSSADEDRRTLPKRITIDRRKDFNPDYKGWEHRDVANRRSHKKRRNSE